MGFSGGLALVAILTLTVGGLVLRQLKKSKRRDSESTLRTDDVSRVLRSDSEVNSRPEDESGEENEASRRDLQCNSRTDNASGEEYDVFLSFRGSDTHSNFTDHLYHSMVRAGIRVFLDNEERGDGYKISEVLKAIDASRIYIPIFSQNFASSVWCLREVERIVECHSKSNGKKEIMPIFYDMKADDVKLRTDMYKNAVLKHKKFPSKEVQQWESALKTIGKIIGRELQGKRQAEQIDSIVEEVSCKLNTRHMTETENLVEDSAQVEAIMKLLDVGSDGVRFVGIHGTSGVGKTTLAKVMFNKLSFHFEGCCFLEDIQASSQLHDGLLNLQKKLLSGFVSSGITDQIKDVGDGIKMIKDVFSDKKVLIVLDDLDKKEQLQNLAGKSNWFYSGSRIIITTREESILNTQVDRSKGILPHEVVGMRFDLALRLFYKFAFRSNFAVKEYEDFSRNIVRKVGMLPLAVVVTGSHLFDLANHLRNTDKREVWDKTLRKLEEGLSDDVRDTLLLSYEQLKDIEKEVFLDIACFFTNEDRTFPVIMWKDRGYNPHTAIGVLSRRSLIKIRDDNRFWMHDQIRDFGRDIVLRECPHKIGRVWIREKALELLEAKKKNEDVKAPSLRFNGHRFTQEELACLPKPRFLRGEEYDFSDNFENLHLELRWLSWQTWQTTFPAEIFNFSKLVVLDLSNSDIEDGWVGWSQMKMNKLKVLDLTGCIQLKRTPDFSNFVSLEKLILAWCVKLTTIDNSIGKLKLLKTLNIKGCTSLGELPAEVGSLQALTEITMPRNFQPLNLPETFGNLKSLLSFVLDEHPGITRLPGSIGQLVTLERLSLCGCVGIKELPPSIGDLKMLVELDLSRSGIVELPDSIGNLRKLKVIRVSYTVIRKFPRTIAGMEMLEELHAKKCWCLTGENLEEIGKLFHLRILDLSYTRVSRLPGEIGHLSHMQTLELGSIDLREVPAPPSSVTRLHLQALDFSFAPDLSGHVNLDYLELCRLPASADKGHGVWTNALPKEVQWEPEELPILQLPSGLSTLKLNSIGSLPDFSNSEHLSVLCVTNCPMSLFAISPELVNLRELKLSNCEYLEEIRGLSLLKNLWRLDLNRLERLVEIQGLSEVESLLHLRIFHCNSLERLPDLSKLDKLQFLELKACQNIRAIPGVKGLESSELDIHNCTVLERLQSVSSSTWLIRRVPMYDVFLSFRGSDTRYSIINFLRKSLTRNQISVFKDDELRFGEDIGRELLQALDDSRVYIPVFSREYARSQCCLRELAHMVQCSSQSKGERRIIPIFYNVEIDDVKLESTLYSSALDEHWKNFDHNEVNAWKEALIEVAAMKGFVLKTNSCTPEEVLELATKEVLGHLTFFNARRRAHGGEDLW